MFSGCVGGLWLFKDEANGTTHSVNVGQDSSPSKVKVAFDAAYASLSPASKTTLVGYDPRGNKFRYSSVQLAKKFDR